MSDPQYVNNMQTACMMQLVVVTFPPKIVLTWFLVTSFPDHSAWEIWSHALTSGRLDREQIHGGGLVSWASWWAE